MAVFGLIGLGVMGRNFLLNVAEKGFDVVGYDLDSEKVNALIAEGSNFGVQATTNLTDFLTRLERPRRIMLLVPAGKIVDSVMEDLLPHLSEGDCIVDGGNSHFEDTNKRIVKCDAHNVLFLGTGVSGGAEGARKGPSIMPGGNKQAYQLFEPIFKAAAAKFNGKPCIEWIGKSSSGHFAKMVHNGIEYAMMQLIAEAYYLLKHGASLSNSEIGEHFKEWNKGVLSSFLMEISSEIMFVKDELSQHDLIDMILDAAKQKGTGKWTSQCALDLGIPIPTIDMSVTMRQLSARKAQRVQLSKMYHTEKQPIADIKDIQMALQFGFRMSYIQGFDLLIAASREFDYQIDIRQLCDVWSAGCIIRSSMLREFEQAFQSHSQIDQLLTQQFFVEKISLELRHVRKLIAQLSASGLPMACMTSAWQYFENMRTERLPSNMIQAQRDFFGSHTYERIDRDGIFHTEWK